MAENATPMASGEANGESFRLRDSQRRMRRRSKEKKSDLSSDA